MQSLRGKSFLSWIHEEVGEALIDYLKDDVKIVVNKPEEIR